MIGQATETVIVVDESILLLLAMALALGAVLGWAVTLVVGARAQKKRQDTFLEQLLPVAMQLLQRSGGESQASREQPAPMTDEALQAELDVAERELFAAPMPIAESVDVPVQLGQAVPPDAINIDEGVPGGSLGSLGPKTILGGTVFTK